MDFFRTIFRFVKVFSYAECKAKHGGGAQFFLSFPHHPDGEKSRTKGDKRMKLDRKYLTDTPTYQVWKFVFSFRSRIASFGAAWNCWGYVRLTEHNFTNVSEKVASSTTIFMVTCRWRRHVLPKRQLISTGLYWNSMPRLWEFHVLQDYFSWLLAYTWRVRLLLLLLLLLLPLLLLPLLLVKTSLTNIGTLSCGDR